LFVGQSVCLLVTNVSPAKIVEPIEILFGCGLGGGEKPYITWVSDPSKKGDFGWRGYLGILRLILNFICKEGSIDAAFGYQCCNNLLFIIRTCCFHRRTGHFLEGAGSILPEKYGAAPEK